MPRRAEKFRAPWLQQSPRPTSYRRGYGGKNWATIRKQVIVRDSSTCQVCGRVVDGRDCQVDHKIPKKRGGDDSLENLWVLCQRCHQAKTARGD